MIRVFKRMFKVAQSEAHAAVDRLEDPIKMTEQGIRDLRKDLEASMKNLAEVKALTAAHLRELEEKIRDLQAMHDTLAELADCCSGDDRPDCPIIRSLADD